MYAISNLHHDALKFKPESQHWIEIRHFHKHEHFDLQNSRKNCFGREYVATRDGSFLMSSACDHIYTPRSCRLPGTVFSSIITIKNVTTMFKDMMALNTKSNCKILHSWIIRKEATDNSQTNRYLMLSCDLEAARGY